VLANRHRGDAPRGRWERTRLRGGVAARR
jgi:hypothetical protein